jgi:hypothetical protein
MQYFGKKFFCCKMFHFFRNLDMDPDLESPSHSEDSDSFTYLLYDFKLLFKQNFNMHKNANFDADINPLKK